jgi:hypothetical protein
MMAKRHHHTLVFLTTPCRSAVEQMLSSQVAAEWGATAVMLHVDASNDAASQLYRQRQYRLLAEPRRSWLSEAVTCAEALCLCLSHQVAAT